MPVSAAGDTPEKGVEMFDSLRSRSFRWVLGFPAISVLAAATGLLVGTREASVQSPQQHQEDSIPAPPGFDARRTAEWVQREIARQVPGFGGFFVDPADPERVRLWIKDPDSDFEEAALVFRELIEDHPLADRYHMVPLQGQFGYLEIQQWHDSVFGTLLRMPGTVYTDNQEAKNRIEVGVLNEGAARAAELALIEAGVPLDAVTFEIVEREIEDNDLEERHRPLWAGIRIDRDGGGYCTLGPIAYRGAPGFVTNSHCTSVFAGVDGSRFYQDIDGDPDNYIGWEVLDPAPVPGVGGVCPPGDLCRFSDAAWIQLDPPAGGTSYKGYIAHPGLNSTNWNDEEDWYAIQEEMGIFLGQCVQKVGKTTGRTAGRVINTNINMVTEQNGTEFLLLWQHRADYERSGGDSGGPVFWPIDAPTTPPIPYTCEGVADWGGDYVWLYGIHRSGTDAHGTFSDINYMQFGTELGGLDTVWPGAGGGSGGGGSK